MTRSACHVADDGLYAMAYTDRCTRYTVQRALTALTAVRPERSVDYNMTDPTRPDCLHR